MSLTEHDRITIPITTRITVNQKKRLKVLADSRANGQDEDMSVYIREGIDLVCRKYGVTNEQAVPVS